jgi:hypothetical protein
MKVLIRAGHPPVAEVRIDGERHEAASRALLAMDWPRDRAAGMARSYVLFVHRE